MSIIRTELRPGHRMQRGRQKQHGGDREVGRVLIDLWVFAPFPGSACKVDTGLLYFGVPQNYMQSLR